MSLTVKDLNIHEHLITGRNEQSKGIKVSPSPSFIFDDSSFLDQSESIVTIYKEIFHLLGIDTVLAQEEMEKLKKSYDKDPSKSDTDLLIAALNKRINSIVQEAKKSKEKWDSFKQKVLFTGDSFENATSTQEDKEIQRILIGLNKIQSKYRSSGYYEYQNILSPVLFFIQTTTVFLPSLEKVEQRLEEKQKAREKRKELTDQIERVDALLKTYAKDEKSWAKWFEAYTSSTQIGLISITELAEISKTIKELSETIEKLEKQKADIIGKYDESHIPLDTELEQAFKKVESAAKPFLELRGKAEKVITDFQEIKLRIVAIPETDDVKTLLDALNQVMVQNDLVKAGGILAKFYPKSIQVQLKKDKRSLDLFQKLLESYASKVALSLRNITLQKFTAIPMEEFYTGGTGDKTQSHSHISAMTHQFNAVSAHVINDVLQYKTSPEQRAKCIEKWILIANESYELNDYDNTKAILAGLDSNAIRRLRQSWNLVSKKAFIKLQLISKATTHNLNYSTLRKKIKLAQETNQEVIPFLGMYLTDLEFASLPDVKRKIISDIMISQKLCRELVAIDDEEIALPLAPLKPTDKDVFDQSLELEPRKENKSLEDLFQELITKGEDISSYALPSDSIFSEDSLPSKSKKEKTYQENMVLLNKEILRKQATLETLQSLLKTFQSEDYNDEAIESLKTRIENAKTLEGLKKISKDLSEKFQNIEEFQLKLLQYEQLDQVIIPTIKKDIEKNIAKTSSKEESTEKQAQLKKLLEQIPHLSADELKQIAPLTIGKENIIQQFHNLIRDNIQKQIDIKKQRMKNTERIKTIQESSLDLAQAIQTLEGEETNFKTISENHKAAEQIIQNLKDLAILAFIDLEYVDDADQETLTSIKENLSWKDLLGLEGEITKEDIEEKLSEKTKELTEIFNKKIATAIKNQVEKSEANIETTKKELERKQKYLKTHEPDLEELISNYYLSACSTISSDKSPLENVLKDYDQTLSDDTKATLEKTLEDLNKVSDQITKFSTIIVDKIIELLPFDQANPTELRAYDAKLVTVIAEAIKREIKKDEDSNTKRFDTLISAINESKKFKEKMDALLEQSLSGIQNRALKQYLLEKHFFISDEIEQSKIDELNEFLRLDEMHSSKEIRTYIEQLLNIELDEEIITKIKQQAYRDQFSNQRVAHWIEKKGQKLKSQAIGKKTLSLIQQFNTKPTLDLLRHLGIDIKTDEYKKLEDEIKTVLEWQTILENFLGTETTVDQKKLEETAINLTSSPSSQVNKTLLEFLEKNQITVLDPFDITREKLTDAYETYNKIAQTIMVTLGDKFSKFDKDTLETLKNLSQDIYIFMAEMQPFSEETIKEGKAPKDFGELAILLREKENTLTRSLLKLSESLENHQNQEALKLLEKHIKDSDTKKLLDSPYLDPQHLLALPNQWKQYCLLDSVNEADESQSTQCYDILDTMIEKYQKAPLFKEQVDFEDSEDSKDKPIKSANTVKKGTIKSDDGEDHGDDSVVFVKVIDKTILAKNEVVAGLLMQSIFPNFATYKLDEERKVISEGLPEFRNFHKIKQEKDGLESTFRGKDSKLRIEQLGQLAVATMFNRNYDVHSENIGIIEKDEKTQLGAIDPDKCDIGLGTRPLLATSDWAINAKTIDKILSPTGCWYQPGTHITLGKGDKGWTRKEAKFFRELQKNPIFIKGRNEALLKTFLMFSDPQWLDRILDQYFSSSDEKEQEAKEKIKQHLLSRQKDLGNTLKELPNLGIQIPRNETELNSYLEGLFEKFNKEHPTFQINLNVMKRSIGSFLTVRDGHTQRKIAAYHEEITDLLKKNQPVKPKSSIHTKILDYIKKAEDLSQNLSDPKLKQETLYHWESLRKQATQPKQIGLGKRMKIGTAISTTLKSLEPGIMTIPNLDQKTLFNILGINATSSDSSKISQQKQKILDIAKVENKWEETPRPLQTSGFGKETKQPIIVETKITFKSDHEDTPIIVTYHPQEKEFNLNGNYTEETFEKMRKLLLASKMYEVDITDLPTDKKQLAIKVLGQEGLKVFDHDKEVTVAPLKVVLSDGTIQAMEKAGIDDHQKKAAEHDDVRAKRPIETM